MPTTDCGMLRVTVLVVDDEPQIRYAVRHALTSGRLDTVDVDGDVRPVAGESRPSVRVIEATTGRAAIDLAAKEAPALVSLQREFGPQGFTVLGANADAMLGLGTSEEAQRRYIQEENISFPVVRWTLEADGAYGRISIYPALFLIDRQGIVAGHTRRTS